jgi:hypothetical protein
MSDTSALSAISGPVPTEATKGLGKMFASLAGDSKRVQKHMIQSAHTVRLYAESALVGAALGAVHAANPQVGLDIIARPAKAAQLDPKTGQYGKPSAAVTIPADLAFAVAAGIGAQLTAGSGVEGVSADMRNMGSAALAVFSFRKGADVVAAKMRALKKPSGGTVPSLVSLQKEVTAAAMHGDDYGQNTIGHDGRDPILIKAATL